MQTRNFQLLLLTTCLCVIEVQCQDSILSLRCLDENSGASKKSQGPQPCEIWGKTVMIFSNFNRQLVDSYNPDYPRVQKKLPSAVGFIDNGSPYFGYYRDSSRVPVCRTISGASVAERPTWADSANLTLVNELINTHCFVQQVHALEPRRFPYKILNKVVNENGAWSSREIGYLLPDDENYLVLKGYADIDAYCSRCALSGRFGGFQPPLANPPKNLHETLHQLLKNRG